MYMGSLFPSPFEFENKDQVSCGTRSDITGCLNRTGARKLIIISEKLCPNKRESLVPAQPIFRKKEQTKKKARNPNNIRPKFAEVAAGKRDSKGQRW
jgi:hypothetical protein